MLAYRHGCLPQYNIVVPVASDPGTCVEDAYWTTTLEDLTWVLDLVLTGGWGLTGAGKIATAGSVVGGAFGSEYHSSGKWYFEVLMGGVGYNTGLPYAPSVGMAQRNFSTISLPGVTSLILGTDGSIYNGGSTLFSGLGVMAAAQVLMFAYDAGTGKCWIGRNGTWFNSGNPAAGTGAVFTFAPGFALCPNFTRNNGVGMTATIRGKVADFTYALPAGFSGWGGCTSGTAALLHGDGTDGSLVVTDSSSFVRAVTNAGLVTNSALKSVYGSSSLLFPGAASDYLTVLPASGVALPTEFDWFNGDGHFSCWVYPTSLAANKMIWATVIGSFGASLRIETGTLRFRAFDNNSVDLFTAPGFNMGAISANVWTHVEIDKVGDTFYFFVNGALIGNQVATRTMGCATTFINVGRNPSGGDNFIGNIDEFKWIKGHALHTLAFTPETIPYCSRAPIVPPSVPVTPPAITATGATALLLVTSGTASVGAAPVPSVDFVDHAPACYENAGTLSVQLALTSPYAIAPCSVAWATSDGSAIAGTDYTTSSGTANFTDAVRTVTLAIPILDNAAYAAGASKTLTITLSAPSGCSIVTASVVARIIDNDPLPATVTLADGYSGAFYEIGSNGVEDGVASTDAAPPDTRNWVLGAPIVAVGASFEVRATLLGGVAHALSPGTYGAWLNLGTTRIWGARGGPLTDAQVFFEIREATTAVVVDTATILFRTDPV